MNINIVNKSERPVEIVLERYDLGGEIITLMRGWRWKGVL